MWVGVAMMTNSNFQRGLGVNVGSWDRGGAGLVLVGGGLRLHTGVMGLLGAVLVKA